MLTISRTLFIVFIISNAGHAQKSHCKIAHSINSEYTNDNQTWPWLSAVLRIKQRQFICGGSLISRQHVLSGQSGKKLQNKLSN